MREYRDIYEWTAPRTGCTIALGRFDGVHLGHRSLLDRAVKLARTHQLTPVCFSFQESTYPRSNGLGQLTTDDEKVELLEQIGMEVLLHPRFESPLVDMSAHDFLHSMLFERWLAAIVVAGYDFHFGKNRQGDIDYLLSAGKDLGIKIEIISPFVADGEIVKATRIRELLRDGVVDRANALLGRPYSVRVHPVRGRGLGREIGFPTINFPWPDLKVKVLPGIYAVRTGSEALDVDAISGSRSLKDGVANFGFQPTIDPPNREPVLEVHILDEVPPRIAELSEFPPDMVFTVEFIDFIRPEQRFDSIDELRAQIGRDCDKARQLLGTRGSLRDSGG